METSNKYYLNDEGLTTLVKSISELIVNHTSNEVKFDENGNLLFPNNFPTLEALTLYLKDRKYLTIKQGKSIKANDSFLVAIETIRYNGEEDKELNLNLVSSEEIDNLF